MPKKEMTGREKAMVEAEKKAKKKAKEKPLSKAEAFKALIPGKSK